MISRWNIGLKLHATIAGLTLFSVLFAGLLIYQLASSAANKIALKTAYAQLEATRSGKAMQIEHYFQTMQNQLISLSGSLMITEATKQFSKASKDNASFNQTVTNKLKRQQLAEYYHQDFNWQYAENNPASSTFKAEKVLHQLDDLAVSMQYDYIFKNPNPLGKKDNLDAADGLHSQTNDHSAYRDLHKIYHFHLRHIQKTMDYYDIFLIEPEQGRVIYSVLKEVDFGTRLQTGPWANSGLADAYHQAMRLQANDIYLTDMAPYAPSYENQAIFLSTPIYHENSLIGILIVQLPIHAINNIMTNNFDWQHTGSGRSGESYLVGNDFMMRSESRFRHENQDAFLSSLSKAGVNEATLTNIQSHDEVIGYVKVNTVGVRRALNGEEGVYHYNDYRDISVLSAYQPLQIAGQQWVLLSEIDESEAFASVRNFENTSKNYMIMISIVLAMLAIVVGGWFSRRLIGPMQAVTKQLISLSQGKVGHATVLYNSNDEIADLIQASKYLDESMQHAIDQSKRIANGDFSKDIEVRGESDELGQALLDMNQTLRSLSNIAAAIATGDYSVDVNIKSQQDQLGRSISHMTKALRLSSVEAEQLDWLKSNLAEISQQIQSTTRLQDLAATVMKLLPGMVHASHATFFTWQHETQSLVFQDQFAGPEHRLVQQFKLSEGLIGQCAREKNIMTIENIPEDYLHVVSSLGHSKPQMIIMLPLLADDETTGVIELALLHPLNDIQMSLLQQLSPTLGMAVFIVQQTIHTKKLLDESQALSEELQAQEEELREANTALELRAEELSASEEELQAQQEELRLSNESLISHNKTVEAQKDDLEASAKSLAQQADQLTQASQYKSDFLSNMSHELRTPLNSLLILSEMLSKNKEGNLTEKQVKFSKTIHESGIDLLALINNILDLAKVEAGKMELDPHSFPIRDIADAMARHFTHMAEKRGISFHVQCADDLPEMVFHDAIRIKQVVKNLLSNALKFTSQGFVTFQLDRVDATHISLSVVDSGVGIAADKLNDIFVAFQQEDGSTSRKYGGTGLGLSICKEFAALLGGHINVQSIQGKGSTFSLIIPIKCAKPDHAPATDLLVSPEHSIQTLASENVQLTNSGLPITNDHPVEKVPNPLDDDRDHIHSDDRTILIVEDDIAFASIQQQLVQEHGFKAINALRGDHGLLLAQQYKPQAILLDLQLPVLDGISLLDSIKSAPELSHIPIHVISCMDQGTQKRILQAGALSFIEKPASRQAIHGVLNDISNFIERDIKRLLIVEDNEKQLLAMTELLSNDDVQIIQASTATEALNILRKNHVDCMILDLTLPDMSGEEVLQTIDNERSQINQGHILPVIVHTGKDLSQDQVEKLQAMSKSIIVKGSHSTERLQAETSLFLHQIEGTNATNPLLPKEPRHGDITTPTVLLVDDDIRNIYSLSSFLESQNITVYTARNGLESLTELEKHVDSINIILMDIMMPKMDGYEAMQEIRKNNKHKNLPIIALTAKAMKGDRDQCIAAGASDYITKPIDTDKLISLMRVWLHQ